MSLTKWKKAIKGLGLIFQHLKVFDLNVFASRRIAIVGPASSTFNTGKGNFIDGFDCVIRINKAPLILREGKGSGDIGTKTDVLFHSFVENELSGGGALDFQLYDMLGIRYVINPIPTYFGYRLVFNFYKKYLSQRVVYILPKKLYRDIPNHFGKFRPTTGYCALKASIESEFKELYITGFTFFKTAYADGYRDPRKEAKQALQYIKDENIHNPDLEYEGFKQLLVQNASKNIILDTALEEILRRDKTFEFERIFANKLSINK